MNIFNLYVEDVLKGLADNMSLEDIAKKHSISLEELKAEFKKGIEVEKEHTDDVSISKEITMDHLFEDPKYYTKLKKAEK
jgi:predicted transcriptional regulator